MAQIPAIGIGLSKQPVTNRLERSERRRFNSVRLRELLECLTVVRGALSCFFSKRSYFHVFWWADKMSRLFT